MDLIQQIMWGSVFMGVCVLLHVALLALCIWILAKVMDGLLTLPPVLMISVGLLIALAILVLSTTLQVWIWSAVWIHYGILSDWNTALYFSLVTCTTLGYGDVVLGPEARIFAGLGAVTGSLGFGLSSAFLVALTTRLLSNAYRHHKSGENSLASGAP